MSEWQHTRRSQDPIPECLACWDEHIEDICMEPTPDPASPCGYVYRWPDDGALPTSMRCFWRAEEHGPDMVQENAHPHRPTLCTCGHPITEVTA